MIAFDISGPIDTENHRLVTISKVKRALRSLVWIFVFEINTNLLWEWRTVASGNLLGSLQLGRVICHIQITSHAIGGN